MGKGGLNKSWRYKCVKKKWLVKTVSGVCGATGGKRDHLCDVHKKNITFGFATLFICFRAVKVCSEYKVQIQNKEEV